MGTPGPGLRDVFVFTEGPGLCEVFEVWREMISDCASAHGFVATESLDGEVMSASSSSFADFLRRVSFMVRDAGSYVDIASYLA